MADDIHRQLGLRRVINVAGTMTTIGSSIMVPEAIAAAGAIGPHFLAMAELQQRASAAIAEVTGAEAGFVTASCSAAITLSVAATITGPDLAAIEALPDAGGRENRVIVQTGHLVNYGAPIDQAIRLAGGRVVPVGQATGAAAYQLDAALADGAAAALYVVSHHAVHYGQLPLPTFAAICRARGVPVIVDAASEYDLRGFLAAGADLVLYSGHKFLGGPTAGIIAGTKDLVRAAYLQNRGIGRGMKIGKEGIAGLLAALAAWQRRDAAAIRSRERQALEAWATVLAGRPGITAVTVPDPTGNPLERLQVAVEPETARISAWDLVAHLAGREPAVVVREEEVDLGRIELDPCSLHPGESEEVSAALVAVLEAAQRAPSPLVTPYAQYRLARDAAALAWPDASREA